MGLCGVISPLIANFALDGLENIVTSGHRTTMTYIVAIIIAC